MFCSCRISTDKRVARSLCHSRATCSPLFPYSPFAHSLPSLPPLLSALLFPFFILSSLPSSISSSFVSFLPLPFPSPALPFPLPYCSIPLILLTIFSTIFCFFFTFLPRDAMLSAVYAVVVCLCVCLSHSRGRMHDAVVG